MRIAGGECQPNVFFTSARRAICLAALIVVAIGNDMCPQVKGGDVPSPLSSKSWLGESARVQSTDPSDESIVLEQTGKEAENRVADWTLHLQNTNILQSVPNFHAPYSGPQSLTPNQTRETISLTLFLGRRLWTGASTYIDPEFFQGPSFNTTFGAAGFPNGEAQKAGKFGGELYIARAYFQQVIGFGGETEHIDDGQNQLADVEDISRLTKFINSPAYNRDRGPVNVFGVRLHMAY